MHSHCLLYCLCCVSTLQESPAANKIKEAFFSEKGLAGNVQKLPLEKVFEIESVKKVRAVSTHCHQVLQGYGGGMHGVQAGEAR